MNYILLYFMLRHKYVFVFISMNLQELGIYLYVKYSFYSWLSVHFYDMNWLNVIFKILTCTIVELPISIRTLFLLS